MDPLLILLSALLLDALVGDPDVVWRRVPHPVVYFGRLIGWLDGTLNREDRGPAWRRVAGMGALVTLLSVAIGVGVGLESALALVSFGWVLEVVVLAVFLAQKSLYDHVARVAQGLKEEGLAGGRAAVSQIVGRDPEQLDAPAVCRASIETLAENFSDGVVAPVFWYAVGGLPGVLAYKALNTADSMIGHRTERHEAFGWASARLDDIANWPAARLSALFAVVAAAILPGMAPREAARSVFRDAGKHRSVNAGWPEAAFAGALGLRLAGPRVYGGETVTDAWMGSGREAATVADISRSLALFVMACAVMAVSIAVLWALQP